MNNANQDDIACISVNRVFDFCSQEQVLNGMFSLPGEVAALIPAAAALTWKLVGQDCRVLARRPVPGLPSDYRLVTFLVTVTLALTLHDGDGNPLYTFTHHHSFIKTVTLCAPEGCEVECFIPPAVSGPGVIVSRSP